MDFGSDVEEMLLGFSASQPLPEDEWNLESDDEMLDHLFDESIMVTPGLIESRRDEMTACTTNELGAAVPDRSCLALSSCFFPNKKQEMDHYADRKDARGDCGRPLR